MPNPLIDIQRGVPGLLTALLGRNPMVATSLAATLEGQVRDLTDRALSPLATIALNQTLKPLFAAHLPNSNTPLPTFAISDSRAGIGQAAHTITLNTMTQLRGQYDARDPQSAKNKQVLADMRRVIASAIDGMTRQSAIQTFEQTQATPTRMADGTLPTTIRRAPPPPPTLPKPDIKTGSGAASVGLQRRARVDKTAGARAAARLGSVVKKESIAVGDNAVEIIVDDAKRTVPRHDYEAVRANFGGHRFSRLAPLLGLGTLTPTIASGAWGKVRFLLTDKNEELAVKELRLAFKPGISKFNREKTRQSEWKQIQKETHLTIAARNPIDASINLPAYSKLKVTRSSVEPFKVHRMITDLFRNKIYVIMNREAGTVADLEKTISADLKHTLAMSIAAQGFVELGLLHKEAQIAHMDLKTDNLLFSKSGQIKIMDYGLATQTRQGKTGFSGRVGSIVSPEMVLTTSPRAPMRELSTSNDVWAMAVIIASTAAPTGARNPFMPTDREIKAAMRETGATYPMIMARNLLAYQQWRATVGTPAGQIDVRRIQMDRRGSFNDFFARLAVQEPRLCHVLLNHALVLEPERRASASTLGRQVLGLLPEDDTKEFAALRHATAEYDRNSNVAAMMGHAIKFRKWESDYFKSKRPPIVWPRGQARNLPR